MFERLNTPEELYHFKLGAAETEHHEHTLEEVRNPTHHIAAQKVGSPA